MNAVVLLAEDEPVSRVFLVEALEALGVRCDAVDDGLEALRRARSKQYDALLLDLNLPHRDGIQILAGLRDDAQAASRSTPALALTADDSAQTRQRLLDAGFAAVATKPIMFDRLAAVLREIGIAVQDENPVTDDARTDAPVSSAYAVLPVWNDAHALAAAGGNAAIVEQLRALMLQELPTQRDAIRSALRDDDAAAARAQLHRLQASCGFCGATALAESSRRLHAALAVENEVELHARRFFDDVARLEAAVPSAA